MVCECLPKDPTAPAQARRLLDCLGERLEPQRLDDAKLLVSEVVANAVEHVPEAGVIEVAVQLEDRRLRVDVVDPGHGFEPRPRDPSLNRGWGLQFVQALADRWGTGNGSGGRVWFEMTA